MHTLPLPRYVVLNKKVGETPLSCAEVYRSKHPELTEVPLAYAGRLDPMASGKLLVLIGDECKRQTEYHGLDKEYQFSILFGIASDTQDVLGRLETCSGGRAKLPGYTQPENLTNTVLNKNSIEQVVNGLHGDISLPYPHFSSKTVRGKALHTWTLEGRLNEIEIPTQTSTIYDLELTKTETKPRATICDTARAKIDTIPPVTDARKAIGNDFRRVDVRRDWEKIKQADSLPETYIIAHLRCIASSGSYMRSLAALIATKLDTCGLAWHIHRTKIGKYEPTKHRWQLLYE